MHARTGDRVVLGSSVRDHIGGRWAISWIAYAINVPINLLGITSNVIDARDAPPLAWLAVWSLGYAALGLVFLVANATLFRNRRVSPVPIWWVVALGAVAGGSRGLVVGVAADVSGISGATPGVILLRVVTGTVLGMVLVPAAALLLSLIASYSARRRELIGSIVTLERERMQVEGESDRLRAVLLADVERNAAHAAGDDQVRSARELSHRLWRDAPPPDPRTESTSSWQRVLLDTLTNYPYPAGAIAGIWAVGAVWGLVASIGFARGVVQTVVSAVVIWGAFTAASRVHLSRPIARFALLVGTLTTVVVLTGPVASVVFDPRPPGTGTGQVIANSMWIPVLAIIVGIIVSAVRSGEEVLDRLTSDVRKEEISALAAHQERARIQREVAEALHGVQSRVLSARAAGQVSGFSLTDVLGSPWAIDPEVRLDRTLATWGLLMDVHISDLPADITDRQRRDIARVVDEACANAHRHGGATTCWITVDEDADGVVVRVDDDGSGITRDSTPGLGSGLFASVSRDDWSLAPRPEGGAALIVRLG